jgi:phospholipid/cholesterol/gamma-HCH transport system permease protein
MNTEMAATGKFSVAKAPDSSLRVELSGDWHLQSSLPSPEPVVKEIGSLRSPAKVTLEGQKLGEWDSGLLIFLRSVAETCKRRQIDLDLGHLPAGVARLIHLSEAVPEREGARSDTKAQSFLARVGLAAIGAAGSINNFVVFLGAVTIAFVNLARGKARFRRVDFAQVLQECGAEALGIVSLISFLVGVILAFMGAVQLQQFGAAIYVADLVAIGVARDMGAMMTAIIMSGRTGAAFAARLGTMKVTQEIDALATMGISPLEFLVLPRVLALLLMMPILCLYSDLMGMLGGAAVGTAMLGLPLKIYYRETIAALTLIQVFGGVFKATVYGGLIGISGCLRGFQCGTSASAVGDAATQAVVMGIVMVVVACGLFAVIFNALGI